jgi:methyltransferase (TIGR00027 family)
MTRTDNDSWDLASSVGATATLVAAARAAATRLPDPLIDDPYAEPLVRAVGVDFFTRMAAGDIGADDQAAMGVRRMTANMAARTRYFDEFFAGAAGPATSDVRAADAGLRQAVILAAGLDARAFRLAWPPDMVAYEIDQPEVVAFKSDTMVELRVRATCVRRTVAMDLRNDWATGLRGAAFDPNKPTAWSAEGLLGYLPPDAQDRLLDTITGLSAPGSRIAIDCAPPSDPAQEQRSRERMRAFSDHWREQGFHLDFSELVYIGERNEASAYLTGHGWRVAATGVNDLLAAHGLAPFDDDEPMSKLRYLDATLEACP